MKNIKVEVSKTSIVITIDPNRTFGASKSGKSIVIASTEGNIPIALPDGEQVMLGVNVYKPA